MTTCVRKICIDYGHDGIDESGIRDPGAVGPSGVEEAAVCRAVALLLRDILLAGGQYEALLTHEGPDPAVNYLTPRANIANDWGADILISIHANSFGSPQPRGFEVWTTKGRTESDVLGEYLHQALGSLGLLDRGEKEENFTVIYRATMPAVLVELAFISNPDEEQLLASADGQQAFAQALASGIDSYFAGYPQVG